MNQSTEAELVGSDPSQAAHRRDWCRARRDWHPRSASDDSGGYRGGEPIQDTGVI